MENEEQNIYAHGKYRYGYVDVYMDCITITCYESSGMLTTNPSSTYLICFIALMFA